MSTKVLHIVEAAGGVERYLVTLLTKMKKYSKFEHILVCSALYDKEKFKDLVKSIIVIDEMCNEIAVSRDLKAIIAVRRVIKKCNPDIIYCHSSKAGAIGRIANIGFKNVIIYNAHGWSFNIKGISKVKIKFYEMVERILAILTYKIICISEYEKQSAIRHKICKEEKLVIINNGIDFEESAKLQLITKEEMNIPSDAFVVGTIGRLANQKAPDKFIEMAKIVKEKLPKSFFIIVGDDMGDGHYRKEIDKIIEQSQLSESFLITGWVSNPLDYGGLFDVAVLLSRWEGFGLVLPEYMYLEKPIVATKADAIPYVLGDAGLLVEVDNEIAAADAVIKLYNDTELKNHIISKERERVKLFDAQKTADEHLKVLESI